MSQLKGLFFIICLKNINTIDIEDDLRVIPQQIDTKHSRKYKDKRAHTSH